MTKKLISAIPALRPVNVINATTSEILSSDGADACIVNLIEFIHENVVQYYEQNKVRLINVIQNGGKRFNAAEFARQHNYRLESTLMPSCVLAKSRVEKLFQHKLITEVGSYVFNASKNKHEPSFSLKINLGACDKQMVSLSVDNEILTLKWKVWDTEFLFDFVLPRYVLSRNIIKYSLPTVELRNGIPYFIFSITENTKKRSKSQIKAGIDLGRVEPFTMVVLNKHDKVSALYTANAQIKRLNLKRERLIKERHCILGKCNAYVHLGLDAAKLSCEAKCKRNKITILGKEIAHLIAADVSRKLIKHDMNIVNVEDLRWVKGRTYGGRWNHSAQQECIAHSLAREGIAVKKVNACNTSQECSRCGKIVKHNAQTRMAYCPSCKLKRDRDVNAAINIAKRSHGKEYIAPSEKSRNGGNCRIHIQVTDSRLSQQYVKKSNPSRMTT